MAEQIVIPIIIDPKAGVAGLRVLGDEAMKTNAKLGAGAMGGNKFGDSMKNIARNVLSSINPIHLMAGAVIGLGAALIQSIKGNERLASSTKLLGEAQNAAVVSTKKEVVELQTLFAVAQNTSLTYGTRQAAIDKLNKSYPELHNNLSLENIGNQKVADSVQLVIDNLVKKAKVENILAQIVKYSNELDAIRYTNNKKGINTGFIQSQVNADIKSRIKLIDELTKSMEDLTAETIGEKNLGDKIGAAVGDIKVKQITIKPDKIKVLKPRVIDVNDFNFTDSYHKTRKIAGDKVGGGPGGGGAGDGMNGGGAAGDWFEEWKEEQARVQTEMDQINATIQQTASDAIGSMADSLGNALATGDLKTLFSSFANIIASGISAIGKQMIAMSPVVKMLKEALKTMNPYVMLASGIALVAVGAALRSSVGRGVKGMAAGGLATGPVHTLIGEGRGTNAYNPEVVAPLDKLKKFFSNMIMPNRGFMANSNMGTSGMNMRLPAFVQVKMSGRDMVGVMTLEQMSQGRN